MPENARTRVLNACPACARQYDVGHVRPGGRVRCECGRVFAAEHRAPHTPRALKCSNCGGMLEESARKCAYCAAEITLEERRLDSVCPKCFARMASDSRYCMECGIEIAPQAIFAIQQGVACPRCKGELRTRELGHTSITECGSCSGIWLTQEAFLRLCDRTEAAAIGDGQLRPGPVGPAQPARQGYIPCLACSQLMARKNYASASGVIIDLCREHGVWLDASELERILAFIRDGGLDRARKREIERLEEAERKLRAAQSSTSSGTGLSGLELEPLGRGPRRRRLGWGDMDSTGDAFGAVLGILFDVLF
jgi:Zn-finger nucleic acid-binding protein